MIFNQISIKKYGAIINIINNSLVLWPGYCIYMRVFPIIILNLLILPLETIAVRIENNIIYQKIVKKSLIKDITNFLQVSNKLSSKKRRQINKSQ